MAERKTEPPLLKRRNMQKENQALKMEIVRLKIERDAYQVALRAWAQTLVPEKTLVQWAMDDTEEPNCGTVLDLVAKLEQEEGEFTNNQKQANRNGISRH